MKKEGPSKTRKPRPPSPPSPETGYLFTTLHPGDAPRSDTLDRGKLMRGSWSFCAACRVAGCLWIEARLRAMGASIWVSAQSKPSPIRIGLKENHTFNSSGVVSDPFQEYPFPHTGLGNERGSRSSQLRAIGRKLTRGGA